MTRYSDSLIKDLFQRNNLSEITKEELLKISNDHPYSPIFNFLYTEKLKSINDQLYQNSISYTSLYFNNQRWLSNLLNEEGDLLISGNHQANEQKETTHHSENLNVEDNFSSKVHLKKNIESTQIKDDTVGDLSFEPYHTIDYFASQGIKLGDIDTGDKLGQKVKSFTEWLKTMKKIQVDEEKNSQKHASSIETEILDKAHEINMETPVITEAMAEIYLKQGLTNKAIEVYSKLSLQNPLNSHIFADRIKAIKENRP